jgi:hypothetical protein
MCTSFAKRTDRFGNLRCVTPISNALKISIRLPAEEIFAAPVFVGFDKWKISLLVARMGARP